MIARAPLALPVISWVIVGGAPRYAVRDQSYTVAPVSRRETRDDWYIYVTARPLPRRSVYAARPTSNGEPLHKAAAQRRGQCGRDARGTRRERVSVTSHL